jgi:hypothetical protein
VVTRRGGLLFWSRVAGQQVVKRRLKAFRGPRSRSPDLASLIESPEGEGSSLCAQPTMSDLTRRKEAQMVEQAKATVQPLMADTSGDEEEGGYEATPSFIGARTGSLDTQKSAISEARDSFQQMLVVC